MSFYFAEIKDIRQDSITLSGAEHKHLTKVMRLKKGARISVTDGAGMVYDCLITRAGAKDTTLEVITSRRNVGEPSRQVTMAIGVSSGSKFDQSLQMCVEAGVSAFVPVLTAKAKVQFAEPEKIQRKLKRWREVVKSALKQSERSVMPEIAPPQALEMFLLNAQSGHSSESGRVIADLHAGRAEAERGLALLNDAQRPLIILVGPESGFTPKEVALATDNGFTPFQFGPSVLRAETAAIALAAVALLGK